MAEGGWEWKQDGGDPTAGSLSTTNPVHRMIEILVLVNNHFLNYSPNHQSEFHGTHKAQEFPWQFCQHTWEMHYDNETLIHQEFS